MATITQDYVESLPKIYRDILSAFPAVEPGRKAGYGLAYQTLFSHLQSKKHLVGQIKLACEQMAQAGVVEIKNGIFVHPTPLGEEIIATLTGNVPPPPISVPPFPKPPA